MDTLIHIISGLRDRKLVTSWLLGTSMSPLGASELSESRANRRRPWGLTQKLVQSSCSLNLTEEKAFLFFLHFLSHYFLFSFTCQWTEKKFCLSSPPAPFQKVNPVVSTVHGSFWASETLDWSQAYFWKSHRSLFLLGYGIAL